jgi:hypothetical protein
VALRRSEGNIGNGGESSRKRWPACKVWIRECSWCSTLFAARRLKQRACSPDHAKRLSWAEASQARHVSEHVCACGAQIPASRNRCDDCRAQTRKNRRRRERGRKRNSVVREPYTLAEIAARDRFRCGLCHKRVPMTKAVPHPQAPTIDHIVPWSVSRDDSRANVQLAHFLCNSLKSAGGGGEQLLLIG